MAEPTGKRKGRDWLSIAGMAAVAGAAAFTSYSGWAGLAEMAGWNHVLAKFLPITVDAYAMTATRVWLSPANLTKKARTWARNNAVGAISISVLGNAFYHAAAAGVLSVTWPVVVALSAVPPITLGLTTHLWHLADDTEPEPAPEPGKESPGPAIAEPAAVNAAYPILGNAGALAVPPPVGAKPGTAGGKPAPTGGTHRTPAQTLPVGPRPVPTGGPQRPSALRRAPQAAASASGQPRVLTDEEVLVKARELAVELGAAPSANQLHVRLGIGPTRARRIADRLATEASAATTGQAHRAAPVAPPQTPATGLQRPTGGPAASGTLNPAAAPPVGPASPSSASTGPAAVGGGGVGMPSQRPAPVAHANGASVEQS